MSMVSAAGECSEWLEGTSGHTVEGGESDLCSKRLGRVEQEAVGCVDPELLDAEKWKTSLCTGSDAYVHTRQWLHRKGGLLEHCVVVPHECIQTRTSTTV